MLSSKPIPQTMAVAFLSLLIAGSGSAAERNDIKMSCYDIIGEQPQQSPRHLFVLIDQTIVPDDHLIMHAERIVQRFLQHGDRITLVSFSAYDANGHYATREFTARIDMPRVLTAEEQRNLPVGKAKRFARCFPAQLQYAKEAVAKKMAETFTDGNRYNFTNTELIGALRTLTEEMIAKSTAGEKVVLIVSDMIENSETLAMASPDAGLQTMDVRAEVQKLMRNGSIPEMADTRVYVIGAGVSWGGYRPAEITSKHKAFWKLFFKVANASLDGYGEPELLADM